MTSEHLAPVRPLENVFTIERQVSRELRRLIVTGELPGGTPLTQRELAARLAVSQTPVRAALDQLEREGLVVSVPRGGSRVTELTVEDMEEIYAARSGLEGLAARRGAETIGDSALGEMRAQFERITFLSAGEPPLDEYLDTRWEFHATCYRASGRDRLLREVYRLFLRAERYNRLVLSTAKRFRESVVHHRRLLEACERRDGEAAEEAIRLGMRWCVECLLPVLGAAAR